MADLKWEKNMLIWSYQEWTLPKGQALNGPYIWGHFTFCVPITGSNLKGVYLLLLLLLNKGFFRAGFWVALFVGCSVNCAHNVRVHNYAAFKYFNIPV